MNCEYLSIGYRLKILSYYQYMTFEQPDILGEKTINNAEVPKGELPQGAELPVIHFSDTHTPNAGDRLPTSSEVWEDINRQRGVPKPDLFESVPGPSRKLTLDGLFSISQGFFNKATKADRDQYLKDESEVLGFDVEPQIREYIKKKYPDFKEF